MERQGGFMDGIHDIVNFLHTEGFYAAEDALLREIEVRYPEMMHPGSSAAQECLSPTAAATLGAEPEAALHHSPAETGDPAGQEATAQTADRAVAEWHQQQQQQRELLHQQQHQQQQQQHHGEAAQADSQAASADPPPLEPLSSRHLRRWTSGASSLQSSPSSKRDRGRVHDWGDVDEYSDEEDVGYWREDIPAQDAFVLTELELSDDEGSPGRSAFGYHRYNPRPAGQSPWTAEDMEKMAGDGSPSSDGHGSSYFSGERVGDSEDGASRQGDGSEPAFSRQSTFSSRSQPPSQPASRQASLTGQNLGALTQQAAAAAAAASSHEPATSHPEPILEPPEAGEGPRWDPSDAEPSPAAGLGPRVESLSTSFQPQPPRRNSLEPAMPSFAELTGDIAPPAASVPTLLRAAEPPVPPAASTAPAAILEPPAVVEDTIPLPVMLPAVGPDDHAPAGLPAPASSQPPAAAQQQPLLAPLLKHPSAGKHSSALKYLNPLELIDKVTDALRPHKHASEGHKPPVAVAEPAAVPTSPAAGGADVGGPPEALSISDADRTADEPTTPQGASHDSEPFSFPVTPPSDPPPPRPAVFQGWSSFKKSLTERRGLHEASGSEYTTDDEHPTEHSGLSGTSSIDADGNQGVGSKKRSLFDVIHDIERENSDLEREASEPAAGSQAGGGDDFGISSLALASSSSGDVLRPDLKTEARAQARLSADSCQAGEQTPPDRVSSRGAPGESSRAGQLEAQKLGKGDPAVGQRARMYKFNSNHRGAGGMGVVAAAGHASHSFSTYSPMGLETIPDSGREDKEGGSAGSGRQVQLQAAVVAVPHTADRAESQRSGDRADDRDVAYEYDQEYIDRKYECLELKIIHRRRCTGFEETKDFRVRINDLIAGRYQVMDFLGSAAFSKAVQALDLKTGMLVCLKIVKNNKDYFDQSLDEIKLLKYVNENDPGDEFGVLRLYDYFYYKEHLFLVCELLRANLYEFQKYNRESADEAYFTLRRIQRISRQVLESLAFLHSLGLIHSDLKPENVLIKSYSRCEVKVIDLGSSCYVTDHLSSYVQSRSYRAPEVILGLPYDQKIDIWSIGCILAELLTGLVVFQNDSLATLLARLAGVLGPIPRWMLRKGRYAHRFITRSGLIYERSPRTGRYEFLRPKRTSLRHRLPTADEGFLSFLSELLSVDPFQRPTAAEALEHPWFQYVYDE